jgi:hypothetical protein
MTTEQEEFFREIEAEAGGEVINIAMVRLLPDTTAIELKRECYGLFAVTAGYFLFRHFASRNWLSTMTAASSAGGGRGEKEITLLIPPETIEKCTLSGEPGFWQRLLHPTEPFFRIQYTDAVKGSVVLTASVIHSEGGISRFLNDLTALIP